MGSSVALDTRLYHKILENKAASVVQDSYEQTFLNDGISATSHVTEIYHLGSATTNIFSIKSGIAATDSPHIKLERAAATAVSTQTFEMSDTATGNSILLDSNSTGKNASLLLENTATPYGDVTLTNSDDTLKFSNGSIELSNLGSSLNMASSTGAVELKNSMDSIKLNNGTIEITNGANSIKINASDIEIATSTVTLKIDAAGLTVNGIPLVTENFITFLETAMFPVWVMDNMEGPVPVFPATTAAFATANANTFLSGGFKTV